MALRQSAESERVAAEAGVREAAAAERGVIEQEAAAARSQLEEQLVRREREAEVGGPGITCQEELPAACSAWSILIPDLLSRVCVA